MIRRTPHGDLEFDTSAPTLSVFSCSVTNGGPARRAACARTNAGGRRSAPVSQFAEMRGRSDLSRETSRRTKAGPVDPSRRTPLLVHVVDEKQVFLAYDPGDGCVDDAAMRVIGERRGLLPSQVGDLLRCRRASPRRMPTESGSSASWRSTAWSALRRCLWLLDRRASGRRRQRRLVCLWERELLSRPGVRCRARGTADTTTERGGGSADRALAEGHRCRRRSRALRRWSATTARSPRLPAAGRTPSCRPCSALS